MEQMIRRARLTLVRGLRARRVGRELREGRPGRIWRRQRSRLADVGRAARRRRRIAHLWRAARRHREIGAGRMAACLAYYGFFAVFAIAVLGFASLGWALRGETAAHVAQRWVERNLPWVDTAELMRASAKIGVVAVSTLVIAGLAWVGEVRSAIRAVWLLDEHPGKWWTRLLTDLLLLAGLGMLLLLSVAITVVVSTAVRWTAADAVGVDMSMTRQLVGWLGLALGIVVNTALAAATLTALPRLKPPMRQIIFPALLVAAGLELLKTVGRLYFERSEANPAYQAVAGAVGLLLFLYLVNHLVLFAAALAATSSGGEAKTLDLAEGGVVVGAEQRTA